MQSDWCVFGVLQSDGQSKLYVEALYDYEATQDGDLGFRLGDKIEIIKDCKLELVATVHCIVCCTSHVVHMYVLKSSLGQCVLLWCSKLLILDWGKP